MKDNQINIIIKYFGLIMQVGLVFVIAVFLCALAGNLLDGYFGTGKIFFVIFLILGIFAGLYSSYKTIDKILKKEEEDAGTV